MKIQKKNIKTVKQTVKQKKKNPQTTRARVFLWRSGRDYDLLLLLSSIFIFLPYNTSVKESIEMKVNETKTI